MKRKIETWQNKQTSKSWCSWAYNSYMENIGTLYHPRGIAYIRLSEDERYCMIKFIYNGSMYSQRIDGDTTHLGAVRQANKFIKEITGGKK